MMMMVMMVVMMTMVMMMVGASQPARGASQGGKPASASQAEPGLSARPARTAGEDEAAGEGQQAQRASTVVAVKATRVTRGARCWRTKRAPLSRFADEAFLGRNFEDVDINISQK